MKPRRENKRTTKAERRRQRNRLVSILTAAVVFFTTYAMVLPAITMEGEVAAQEPGIVLDQPAAEVPVETAAPEPVSAEPAAPEPAAAEPLVAEPVAEPAAVDAAPVEAAMQEEAVPAAAPEEAQVVTPDPAAAEDANAVQEEPAVEENGNADEEAAIEDPASEEDVEEEAEEETEEEEEEEENKLAASPLVFDGPDYVARASFGPEAALPEGAMLIISEYGMGGNDYQAYKACLFEKLRENGVAEEDLEEAVSALRLFGVAFKDKDGVRILPASAVDVEIEYKNAAQVVTGETLYGVTFRTDDGQPTKATLVSGNGNGRAAVEAPYGFVQKLYVQAWQAQDYHTNPVIGQLMLKTIEKPEETTEDVIDLITTEDTDTEDTIEDAEEAEEQEEIIGVGAASKPVWVEDGSCCLYLTYGPEAGIPEDAKFVAIPVTESHPDYEAYKERTLGAVDGQMENSPVLLGMFDLTIYDANDNIINPSAPITISAELGNAMDAVEDVYAVHFVDSSIVAEEETATAAGAELDIIAAESGSVDATFEVSGLSVIGLVGQPIVVPFTASDGSTYIISVDVPANANIPEGAELSVRELLEGTEEYATYLEKTAVTLRVEEEGFNYAKLFDISIVKDGVEVQPAVPVNVSIQLLDKADTSNTQVIHFAENPVEMDTNTNGDTVSFTTPGFSVYAVVEPGGGGDNARIKVNFYGIDQSTPVATYYVKNSDVLKDDPSLDPDKVAAHGYSYIDDIVVDPGLGHATVPDRQMFHGWSMAGPKNYQGTSYEGYDSYVGADYAVDTPSMTIDDIREFLVDLEIKEGDTLDIYPMIFKYYNITYYGDRADGGIDTSVSLGTDTVYLKTTDEKATYIVSLPYSADAHQNFKGWKPTEDTKGYIQANSPLEEDGIYPNNTETTVSGDVVLYVEAPRGNWLTYNANARGATYNAPQFYLADEETVIATNATVENMTRNGYTLEKRADNTPGWYTLKAEYYDDKGEPTEEVPRDANGYLVISDTYFEPFYFGETLDDNVEIFAKWTPKDTANYTIVFHKQNVERTGYDIAGSYVGTGHVSDPIPFTFRDNTDEDYVIDAGGTDRHYTGFCLNHSGTNTLGTLQKTTGYTSGTPNKENVSIPTITPEGDAVLNIYFDRIEYEFRFYYYRQNNRNEYSYAQNSVEYTGNGVYGIASWSNFANNNRPTQTYGQDLTANIENYTAHYFVLNAYYGQTISSMWPKYEQLGTVGGNQAVSFVMMNGTGLKKKINPAGTGIGRGSDTIKGTIEIMDEMILGKTNDADGNFVVIRYNTRNEWRYHILYEQIDGVDYSSYAIHDVQYNGKKYYEDHIYNSRSTNTDVDQQTDPSFTGYEYKGYSGRNGETGGNHNNNARWTTTEGTGPNQVTCYNVRFYYDRLKYPITFYDGNYVTGNNYPGDTNHNRATQLIKDKDPDTGEYVNKEIIEIEHGAPIPNDVKNYTPPIQPGEEGYVFEGWYADEACSAGAEYNFTTMPIGGITVYAKWRQIRYRVFMHSEAFMIDPDTGRPMEDEDGNKIYDDSLFWGSTGAQMSFAIPYGGKVSLPYGTRNEYEFLGWFLDEEGTKLFSDSMVLNEETVPASPVYNKDTDYTDYLDKHGNVDETQGVPFNSDAERSWITKKLDLYGKWRQIIPGAKGIGVIYDVGEIGDEETTPEDQLLYKDEAGAIAQTASTPKDERTYHFLYWVVQKWDSTLEEYIDATDADGNPIICSPGDSFTVKLEYAKAVENPESTEENPSFTYTMQLRAEYGLLDVEKPTHIDWYKNDGEVGTRVSPDHRDKEEGLQINEHVNIWDAPTREGYKFLGWARVPTDVSGSIYDDDITKTKAKVLGDAAKDYLYLNYHAPEGTVAGFFTVTVGGEEKTVTEVAADEVLPYHDMYAVWEKVYTVTVRKVVVGTNADKEGIDFSFTTTGVTPTDGFTLKDYETTEQEKVFSNLSLNDEISIAEEENIDFSVGIVGVYTDAEGEHTVTDTDAQDNKITFNIQGDTVITFTNTRKVKKVKVYKVDDSTPEKPLSGVAFSLDNTTSLTTDGNGYTNVVELYPRDTAYQLTETAPEHYKGLHGPVSVKVNSDGIVVTPTGTDNVTSSGPDGDGVYTIKVVNPRKTYDVTVTKKVVGTDSDKDIAFEFTPNGQSDQKFSLYGREKTEPQQMHSKTFSVKYGDTFEVAETANDLFGTSIVIDGQEVAYPPGSISTGSIEVKDNVSITFTNTRNTHNVQVLKVNEGSTPLGGAVFSLYTEEEYNKDPKGSPMAEGLTSDPQGNINIGPVVLGKYYLVETTAPAGYNLLVNPVIITITSERVTATLGSDSTAVNLAEYITPESGDPYWKITVHNSAGVELPHTGGSGTLPYTLGGIGLIMASALMYIFRMRRRERRLK